MASLSLPKERSHFIPSPLAALIAAGIFDPSLSLPFCCLSPAAFQHSTTGELMSPDPHLISLVTPHSLSPGFADGAHSSWISLRCSDQAKSKTPNEQVLAWSWRPEIKVTSTSLAPYCAQGRSPIATALCSGKYIVWATVFLSSF